MSFSAMIALGAASAVSSAPEQPMQTATTGLAPLPMHFAESLKAQATSPILPDCTTEDEN